MPKRLEFALILLVAMIGVMISFSFDRSHRLMQRDLLRYVQLNMQLERAELERKARKVLNHTSKRVMANAAQASDLALELLDAGEAAPTEAELEQARHLLRQVLAEARGGYRMAQSVITSAAPSRSRQLKRLVDLLSHAHHLGPECALLAVARLWQPVVPLTQKHRRAAGSRQILPNLLSGKT